MNDREYEGLEDVDSHDELWQPTLDANQAVMVAEKLKEMGYTTGARLLSHEGQTAWYVDVHSGHRYNASRGSAFTNPFSRAVCEAAAKVVAHGKQ